MLDLVNIQIEIPVRDLARAGRFYSKNFGLQTVSLSKDRIVYDNNITLYQVNEQKNDNLSWGKNRPEDSIVLVFYVPNCNLAYRELSLAGVQLEAPHTDAKGQRFFDFTDSEGNYCRVVENQKD